MTPCVHFFVDPAEIPLDGESWLDSRGVNVPRVGDVILFGGGALEYEVVKVLWVTQGLVHVFCLAKRSSWPLVAVAVGIAVLLGIGAFAAWVTGWP